jgi:hypothetical protein
MALISAWTSGGWDLPLYFSIKACIFDLSRSFVGVSSAILSRSIIGLSGVFRVFGSIKNDTGVWKGVWLGVILGDVSGDSVASFSGSSSFFGLALSFKTVLEAAEGWSW